VDALRRRAVGVWGAVAVPVVVRRRGFRGSELRRAVPYGASTCAGRAGRRRHPSLPGRQPRATRALLGVSRQRLDRPRPALMSSAAGTPGGPRSPRRRRPATTDAPATCAAPRRSSSVRNCPAKLASANPRRRRRRTPPRPDADSPPRARHIGPGPSPGTTNPSGQGKAGAAHAAPAPRPWRPPARDRRR